MEHKLGAIGVSANWGPFKGGGRALLKGCGSDIKAELILMRPSREFRKVGRPMLFGGLI